MLIEQNSLIKNSLNGKVILLTGAGGGIGLETAKALLYMGARVIIAEINKTKIKMAKEIFNNKNIEFYKINLSSKKEISKMVNKIIKRYGFIDVLINNAVSIHIGKVEDVSIDNWEKCYLVNFKAPLILTQKLLPLMKRKNDGIIVFVSSSGAAPYMGPYEIFKTAQVELANTLLGELEGTAISVFTISPGLVKTETAMQNIQTIANYMQISIDEFYKMNEDHILGVEEAGIGFALSILMAKKYNGQEVGSIQVLNELGFINKKNDNKIIQTKINNGTIELIKIIIQVYKNQYDGWLKRNVFERQWVLRDFKKTVGISAEEYLDQMNHIYKMVLEKKFNLTMRSKELFQKLKIYFERQYKLLQGFEKNPDKLNEYSESLNKYINDLEEIIQKHEM